MRALAVVPAVLVLAACGGDGAGPESVLRSWSEALNDGDYERAGALFAPGAEIVQGGEVLVFETPDEAERWNASLPCRGRIVRAEEEGATVEASFVLGDRPDRLCDAPGAVARVVVRVEDGRIVLWHQLDSGSAPEPVT